MASTKKNTRPSNSWQDKCSEKDGEERITKFHVVCSQMKENIVLQQLIVIARLPHDPADATELGDHYGSLVSELRQQYPEERITGLLLIYPTCLLHVAEASREILNTVLKDVQQQPDSVLLEAKVLLMAHNLQSRLFSDWNYKVLNADQAASKAALEGNEEDNTETLVCCVLSALQQLSKHLPTGSFSGPVLDENPELIIPPDVLEKLLSRDEFLSAQQHLELYDSPLNASVEIGQVNPRSFLPAV